MGIKSISLAVTALVLSTNINAAPITSLQITGGSFKLTNTMPAWAINPAAFANMTIGGYDGSAPSAIGSLASYAPTSVVTISFDFFGPAAIYTAENDGVSSGYAPVTGDITNNNLTLDLSSWTLFWNGNIYNMGSSSDMPDNSVCEMLDDGKGTINCTTAITTTYDANNGTFSASWDAVHLGYDSHPSNGFDGVLSQFVITGNVTAVPVPTAIWLFGSGLIGLIGFARRKSHI